MGTLLTSENFLFFLQFVVPGFIILYFRAQFATGRLPVISERIAAAAILSAIYQAALFPLSNVVFIKEGSNPIVWIAFIFLVPAVVGCCLGIALQKNWFRKLLNMMKLNPVHPIGAAWDWRFGQMKECWCLITLKSGKEWRGHLSGKSFMSSTPGERDIFVSDVYSKTEEGDTWQKENTSLWIAHGEIQSIEFIPLKKEKST